MASVFSNISSSGNSVHLKAPDGTYVGIRYIPDLICKGWEYRFIEESTHTKPTQEQDFLKELSMPIHINRRYHICYVFSVPGDGVVGNTIRCGSDISSATAKCCRYQYPTLSCK
jgi:hypothetical protein